MVRGGQAVPARRTVVARLVPGAKSQVSGLTTSGSTVVISDPDIGRHEFQVDSVLDVDSSQEQLYRIASQPLLEATIDGTNTCCLLHGHSASGKTACLMGPLDKVTGQAVRRDSLLFRTAHAMLNAAGRLRAAMGSELNYKLAVMDVYMDQVHDLGVSFPEGVVLVPKDDEVLDSVGHSAEADAASVVSIEGSVSSMPSLTAGMGAAKREPSAKDLNRFQSTAVQIVSQDGLHVVKGLTMKEVTSAAEVLSCVDAALAFRSSSSPYDPSASHTIISLHCTRKDGERGQPGTVTSVMHLVDLAGTEKCSSPNSLTSEVDAIQRDFKALSQVLQGGPLARTAVGDSPLTRLLSESLIATAHSRLVTSVVSSPSMLGFAMDDLKFARKCMAVELRASVSSGPTPQFVVVDHDGVVHGLHHEIRHLKKELKETHSHYQQLLSKHAPQALRRGPIEREGGDVHFDEGDTEQDVFGGMDEEVATAAVDMIQESLSSKNLGTVSSARSVRSTMSSKSATRQGEAKVRELEEHLERQKHRNETLEEQVGQLKLQLIEIKEKRMQADHLHYKQSKKLTEQAKLTKEQAKAQEEQMHYDIAKERETSASKQAEMKEETNSLRRDFNDLLESIPRFIKQRTEEVADERQMRDSIRSEAKDEIKLMVSTAEQNAKQQVANLKQQSEYILARKSEELEALRKAHEQYVADATAREGQLAEELNYLYTYANRLAGIIEKVEAGAYSVRTLKGTKTYHIPTHDKPVPLNMDRLTYLTTKLLLTDKYETSDAMKAEPGSDLGSPRSPPENDHREVPDESGESSIENGNSKVQVPLSDQYKEEIEARVMTALASNETIEYMRGLEADVQRYRREVQTERKKQHELRIALSSAQRGGSPTSRAPFDSSSRDAAIRSLSATANLPYPTKWGNPLGVSVTSQVTGARPGTAPEHLRSLTRPLNSRSSTMRGSTGSPASLTGSPTGSPVRQSASSRSSFGYRNQMRGQTPVSS